jgi:transposase
MLTMYHQITIKTLAQQGEKRSTIARQLDCHRNTVRNVINRDGIIKKQSRNKSSFFDPYKKQIKTWLDQKVSRLRIYEMLQEEYGIERNYDTLCKYIQKHFPKQPEAYGVQTTEQGEEAEVDFGYLGMLPNREGKLVKAWGIAVILSFSRMGYWAITYDQKLITLMKELTNAYTFFGGVPKKLKVDNLKAAILKNQHYHIEHNQDFLEFTNHYRTVIVACEPYHPEQKGKVEASIKYLQNNFIAGRTFRDGRDITAQLQDWRDNYANRRIHGTTKKIPQEVFQKQEKATLQPLPTEEFSLLQRCIRKVGRNCHIHFGSNYYSVPGMLVGKEVTARYNDHLLRIVYQGEQVTLHRLSSKKGSYVTIRSHLPEHKIYSQTEYQARYEEKMARIGNHAHAFFQLLLKTKESYWNRTTRAILGLAHTYGAEAVEKTLARCLHFQATDLVIIKNIIHNRLYERELEPKLPIARHDNGLERTLPYYQIS